MFVRGRWNTSLVVAQIVCFLAREKQEVGLLISVSLVGTVACLEGLRGEGPSLAAVALSLPWSPSCRLENKLTVVFPS